MKQLNTKSTQIFLKLIDKIKEDNHIRIEVKGYMPLHLEYLHDVQLETVTGKLYSLSHTYVQNGDLMRDPEMCFIVVTDKENKSVIYPQLYRQDSLGLYEESVHISDGRVTGQIPVWQASHCAFANIWMKNLLDQGFLK